MTRPTSAEAYKKIKDDGLLNVSRFQAYDVIHRFGPITAAECWKQCPGRQIDSIRPRLAELKRLGVVREAGKRKCAVTGMTAITWEVTGGLPLKSAPPVAKAVVPTAELELVKKENEQLRSMLRILNSRYKKLLVKVYPKK